MQVANNLIFDSTNASDGKWIKISNYVAFSIHIQGLESSGNTWIEVSNDPNVPTNNATPQVNAPAAPTLSSFQYGGLKNQGTYFVKTTLVTPNGETTASAESSLAVADGFQLTVASPARDTAGIATAYNVYVGLSTGAEVLQNSSSTPQSAFTPLYATGPIPFGQTFILSNGFFNSGIVPPSSNTSGGPAIGINITGNLAIAAASYVAPKPEFGETQIIIDDTNHQVMVNPSCLVWTWLRVRKDNGAQTRETKAFLMGQNG